MPIHFSSPHSMHGQHSWNNLHYRAHHTVLCHSIKTEFSISHLWNLSKYSFLDWQEIALKKGKSSGKSDQMRYRGKYSNYFPMGHNNKDIQGLEQKACFQSTCTTATVSSVRIFSAKPGISHDKIFFPLFFTNYRNSVFF